MLGNFSCFCSCLLFFFSKSTFIKKNLSGTHSVTNMDIGNWDDSETPCCLINDAASIQQALKNFKMAAMADDRFAKLLHRH